MKTSLILILVLTVSTLAQACSSEEQSQQGKEPRQQRPDKATGAQGQRTITQEAGSTTVGLGGTVELNELSFRVFDVRTEHTVYSIPGPGEPPVSRVSSSDGSDEYVAIDYVVENGSDSAATLDAQIALKDAEGDTHFLYGFIEPPGGGLGTVAVEPGERHASTLFFLVPSGAAPELLLVEAAGESAEIDLTVNERGKIPPGDYLHVYHTYHNQRAYEEAYEMIDPASTQEVSSKK